VAVLAEAVSVIVRADRLSRLSGGWLEFKQLVPNQTLCADGEIARVGFMSHGDALAFSETLERSGLHGEHNGQASDLVIVDQVQGAAKPCDWLEHGTVGWEGDPAKKVHAARLKGSTSNQIITPDGWSWEQSLSREFGFVLEQDSARSLRYLRDENGMDVFLNTLTGKEVYVGRTSAAGVRSGRSDPGGSGG